jgi:cold shock CspA family protein
MIGTCTFWHSVKAYGFITAQDGTQYFLHITNFEKGKTPVLGGLIYFELGQPQRAELRLQCVSARYARPLEVKMAGGQVGRTANVSYAASMTDSVKAGNGGAR